MNCTLNHTSNALYSRTKPSEGHVRSCYKRVLTNVFCDWSPSTTSSQVFSETDIVICITVMKPFRPPLLRTPVEWTDSTCRNHDFGPPPKKRRITQEAETEEDEIISSLQFEKPGEISGNFPKALPSSNKSVSNQTDAGTSSSESQNYFNVLWYESRNVEMCLMRVLTHLKAEGHHKETQDMGWRWAPCSQRRYCLSSRYLWPRDGKDDMQDSSPTRLNA